jgi:hypothetical protein
VDCQDRIIYRILDAARAVHCTLGPAFVESIYGRALTAELKNSGLAVNRERAIKIWYGTHLVGRHRLGLGCGQLCDRRIEGQPQLSSGEYRAGEVLFACVELFGWIAAEFQNDRIAMGMYSIRDDPR